MNKFLSAVRLKCSRVKQVSSVEKIIHNLELPDVIPIGDIFEVSSTVCYLFLRPNGVITTEMN